MVQYVTVPKIQIGNLIYDDFTVMYEHLSIFDKLNIDGIIGANMVSKSAWEFNLDQKQITVSNQIDKNRLKDFKKVRVSKTDIGTPTLTLKYFGKSKEKNIYFDTGYNDFFYLSTPQFQILKQANLLPSYIEGEGQTSTNAFGFSEGKTYLTPLKISLGSYQIPTFIANIEEDEESNIGSLWLQHFHTILYKNHLYFKAYDSAIFPTQYESFGIETKVVDQALIVKFIWNSPTNPDLKKIKLNDRILSINGKNLIGLSTKELEELKTEMNKEQLLLLEINKKGQIVELKKQVLLRVE